MAGISGNHRLAIFGRIVTLLVAGHVSAGTIDGAVTAPKAKANLVVYVVRAEGKFRPPAKHVEMDQKGMKFIPFVLPVLVGTTVDFKNSDPVSHNVFSPSGEKYNLGSWPSGETRSYTFTKPGEYAQLCSIHPEMEGYIFVLPNPYFAVTQANGQFTISDVPEGRYEIRVWGKKLKASEKQQSFTVEVSNGKGSVTIAVKS